MLPDASNTLIRTNGIKSMISIARRTTDRVTKWRDGTKRKRWISAGMPKADRSSRHVRGYKGMDKVVDAVRRDTTPTDLTLGDGDQAASPGRRGVTGSPEREPALL